MSRPQRLVSEITRADPSGCRIWTGAIGSNGYGRCNRKIDGKRYTYAHRYFWVLLYGEIPDDLMLDHKCKTRNCVNPTHLRLVNAKENMEGRAVPSKCKYGHVFTPENTYLRPDGKGRQCKKCAASRGRVYSLKKLITGEEYAIHNCRSRSRL